MRRRRGASGPKSLLFQAALLKATAWMNSCKIFMKRLKDVFRWPEFAQSIGRQTGSSFRDAPLGAGPESILSMVVMDSGLVAARRPGMTARWEALRPLQIIIRTFSERYAAKHAAHCQRGAQRPDRRGHGAIECELERVSYGLRARRLLRQADAAQHRIEEMQIVEAAHLARLPDNRHRDRMGISRAHPVRPLIRHIAAVAREQMKFGAARRKAVVIFQVAMFGHRALDLVVADDGAVVVVENGEEFFAVDMHEEIVFAVLMERRGRIRRGHEQESLDLFEAGVEQAVEAAGPRHREQRVFQE